MRTIIALILIALADALALLLAAYFAFKIGGEEQKDEDNR